MFEICPRIITLPLCLPPLKYFPFFQFPNFIGGILGIAQLGLFVVYGFKHKKVKPAVAIT